jgi:hypothetical protein
MKDNMVKTFCDYCGSDGRIKTDGGTIIEQVKEYLVPYYGEKHLCDTCRSKLIKHTGDWWEKRSAGN